MEASKTVATKSNKMAPKKDTKNVVETPSAPAGESVKAAKVPKSAKVAAEPKEAKAPAESKAPKEAKAPKAPKVAKSVSAKAEVTVPTVDAPATEAHATPTESSEVQLVRLAETLKALSTDLSTRVRDAVKAVQEAAKSAKREARDSKKKKRKDPSTMTPEEKAAWEARRSNNAFLVQRPITPELAKFMGLAEGSKRSQTEVTKFISEYVKSHGCFDPSFKRRILPNAALSKLLRVDDKAEVTYLNLQSFLKVHFIKPTPVATA
jgi:chromatin remodeling complex protein RSC6